MTDSEAYRSRKAAFDRLLTLYGRKPVLEALQSPGVRVERLHLSRRNKPAAILDEIIELARQQGADIRHHEPLELSRISRNSQQDQGVAADLACAAHQSLDEFLAVAPKDFRLLMLDGVTNPQNLGMIIRSLAASSFDGLVLSERDNTRISPLAIKASSGALFRAPLLKCTSNSEALKQLKAAGVTCYGLAGEAKFSLFDAPLRRPALFVLGGETAGLSDPLRQQLDQLLHIPMQRGVESLNVAVTAALVAFLCH